jgi:LacI family transcriptional regulator
MSRRDTSRSLPFNDVTALQTNDRGPLARPLQVALLVETSNAYARGLLEGVTAFLREHRRWSVYLSEHSRGESVPHWLEGWRGDGILARIENRRIAQAVAGYKLPTVDLSAARLLPGIPWVETDDAAISRLAFEHLSDRGFRHLGFCGSTAYNWSIWRRDAFCGLAKARDCECFIHEVGAEAERAAEWAANQAKLIRWLRELPKPIGVFACFDIRGRQVLDACRSAGLKVPDEVAVVGVDNDPVLCELADPPMSSVEPDARRTGYAAAELLDQIMAGRQVAPEPHLIPPLGVVARRSTDALAVADEDVATALRFIRDRACTGIRVDAVVETVPLSRRGLENRFRAVVGRTVHEEILRCQVARVRELLTRTDLPLKAIAQKVGIGNVEYLNVLFRRATGRPPGAYRREHRNPSAIQGYE